MMNGHFVSCFIGKLEAWQQEKSWRCFNSNCHSLWFAGCHFGLHVEEDVSLHFILGPSSYPFPPFLPLFPHLSMELEISKTGKLSVGSIIGLLIFFFSVSFKSMLFFCELNRTLLVFAY